MKKPRITGRSIGIALLAIMAMYVCSYFALSRRGYALSDRMNAEGFYFIAPEPTDDWSRKNYGLVRFYYPLIWVEVELGTGRHIAGAPLWNLSHIPLGRFSNTGG